MQILYTALIFAVNLLIVVVLHYLWPLDRLAPHCLPHCYELCIRSGFNWWKIVCIVIFGTELRMTVQ